MISRGQIVGRLRTADYTHHKQKKRIDLWRQRGTGVYVVVPRREYFTVAETCTILRQAKLTSPEIDRFVKGCVKEDPPNSR